jgi:hypothetical protein
MIETYPTDRLYEEVAFIAYHFNWSREEVLSLPHEERQRWCEEISDINERMSQDGIKSEKSDDDGFTLTQAVDFGESE